MAAFELAFDGAEDAALLPGDEDAVWLRRFVAAISFVHIRAFDGTAGESLGVRDDGRERVAVVGVAGQRLGMQDELATGGARIGGHDRHFDAELVGGTGLAFADALSLGRMEGIELPAALTL